MKNLIERKDKPEKADKKDSGKIYSAGIMISRGEMCYAVAENGGITMKTSKSIKLEKNIYTDANPDVQVKIKNGLKNLSDEIGGRYAVINVVLPDPLVKFSFFEQKDNQSQSNYMEVLRLRLAEMLGIKSDLMAFSSTVEAKNNSGLYAVSFSAKKEQVNMLNKCIYESGIAPTMAAPGISFVFNAFYEKLSDKPGALFATESDYWTFLLWLDRKTPVYMVSKWFENQGSKEQRINEAVSESERKLRAYMAGGNKIEIDIIYTAGVSDTMEISAGILKKRFTCECEPLCLPEAGKKQGADEMPLSLTAAVIKNEA